MPHCHRGLTGPSRPRSVRALQASTSFIMTNPTDPQIASLMQRVDMLQKELDSGKSPPRNRWTILSTAVALVASGLSALFSFSATYQTRVHEQQREFSHLLITMNDLARRNMDVMKETRYAAHERSMLTSTLNAENQIYIARAQRLFRNLTSPLMELVLGRQITSVDAYNLSVNFENSGLMDSSLELARAAQRYASNYSEYVAAHRRVGIVMAQLPATMDSLAEHKEKWRREMQLARDTFNVFPEATQPLIVYTHSETEQLWARLELFGPSPDCPAARSHLLAATKFLAEVPDQTAALVTNQAEMIKGAQAQFEARCPR